MNAAKPKPKDTSAASQGAAALRHNRWLHLAAAAAFIAVVAYMGRAKVGQPPAPVSVEEEAAITDATGQYNRGVHYYQSQDYATAAAWFKKASEQGNTAATYSLANLYMNGRGVAQNPARAIAMYRSAAERGNADAQFALGFNYKNGTGVPQDLEEAYFWLSLGLNTGSANARQVHSEVAARLTPEQIAAIEKNVQSWQSRQTHPPLDNR